MIPQRFDEFFTAAASVSGALIGLLFVAITVAPERAHHEDTRVDYHIRASAALLVFSNALTISLAALVPGTSLGWWAVAASFGMVAFALASARSAVTEAARGRTNVRSYRLVIVLLIISGFQIYAGVCLIRNESDAGAVSTIDYVVIGCLAAGIARAWELMSMRNTGVFTSLKVLAKGDDHAPARPIAGSAADAGEAADTAGGTEPGPES